MVTVAVTGAAGLLGGALVHALAGRPGIDRIVALDQVLPAELPAGVDVRQADIRDPQLSGHLDGADVVVHLAFAFDPMRDEDAMRSINVDGTRNAFDAAVKIGVCKIIYTSSATVYGAHPDNEFPLVESSPLRANPDLSYVRHKGEVEEWLWPWVEQHPGLIVTVFRPAIVAGPGVQNFISRMLEAPRFVGVAHHQPPVQFAHVDDVVAALVLAVERDLPGAYNVACEGWLSNDEARELLAAKVVEVPEGVAFELADRLWRWGVSEAPAGQVHFIMHPWVVSVDKLRDAGWAPRHSNRDTLLELAAEHRAWVSVGRVRARRRNVRVAAGAAGGLAAIAFARRVSRRRAAG